MNRTAVIAWQIHGHGFHEVLRFRAVWVSGEGYRLCA
jgi:hypothetical protein